jgi:hypothetical protein
LVFLENILHKIIFIQLFFFARKSEKKSCFLLIETPKPPESARQKQNHTKFVNTARNPPEIGSRPEIFFARQTTFKSARIVQIWQRKPPSGNAESLEWKRWLFSVTLRQGARSQALQLRL